MPNAKPNGGQTLRREIAESWKRTRMAGLAPTSGLRTHPLEFDANSRLMRAAQPVMRALEDELSGSRVGALLADKSAVIVGRYFGQRDGFLEADRVGAFVGAEFTEERSGTNAIATPHETRSPVFVRGEEHYLESFKDFRCVGVPIHNPLNNRLEGILDLMTDAQIEESLMRLVAARVVGDIQQHLIQDIDSQTAAVIAAFHALKGRTSDALILFGDDYMLNNRSSMEVLDASDHRDLAALSAEVRAGESAANVTLSSGRSVGIRVSPLSSPHAKLLRITPAKSVKRVVPRNPALKHSTDHILEQEVMQSRVAVGHVLVTGEHGSGRSFIADRLTEGVPSRTFHIGQMRNEEAIQVIAEALEAVPPIDFLVIEDIELLDARGQAELARLIGTNEGNGSRVILTQSSSAGNEPEGYLQSLCVSHIRLKPLRSMIPEFADIVKGVLAELSPGCPITISTPALDLLKAHGWQGNFNELRGVLASAIKKQTGGEVSVKDIPERYQRVQRRLQRKLSELETSEQSVIEAALGRSGGNKVHAAQELGISRSTLYARLKYFGIS